MKQYNFKKAKEIIEFNSEKLESATLGLHEDWFWTAEEVWSRDKKFIKKLNSKTLIGGITGSFWATPTLSLQFIDGEERTVEVSLGINDGDRPIWFELGCISSEVQANRPDLLKTGEG